MLQRFDTGNYIIGSVQHYYLYSVVLSITIICLSLTSKHWKVMDKCRWCKNSDRNCGGLRFTLLIVRCTEDQFIKYLQAFNLNRWSRNCIWINNVSVKNNAASGAGIIYNCLYCSGFCGDAFQQYFPTFRVGEHLLIKLNKVIKFRRTLQL